jgi:hypothetical protein
MKMSGNFQADHSNHNPASAIPDRNVQTATTGLTNAGTIASVKTDLADGTSQGSSGTTYQLTDLATGEAQSTTPTEQGV